jgi:hypothetical protein
MVRYNWNMWPNYVLLTIYMCCVWINHFINKEIMYYYSRRTKHAVETASLHEPNRSMWFYDIHSVRRCSVQPPEAPRRTCNPSPASVRRPAVYCLLPLAILNADSPTAHLELPDRLPSLLVLLLHSRPTAYALRTYIHSKPTNWKPRRVLFLRHAVFCLVICYTSTSYRRKLLSPCLAAALTPIFGPFFRT